MKRLYRFLLWLIIGPTPEREMTEDEMWWWAIK